MNCRIPRTIESLNASCARGLPVEGTSAWALNNSSPTAFSLHTPSKESVRDEVGWAESGRPCACSACGWLKSAGPRAACGSTSGGCAPSQGHDCQHVAPFASRLPSKYPHNRNVQSTDRFELQPQVRWDYPPSLSISISGGKETYKDSPSNGERTGSSPA